MRHSSSRLAFASLVMPMGLISACGKSSQISIATNPDVLNATNPTAAAQGNPTCLAPDKVVAGIDYTCADGKKQKGTFDKRSMPQCKEDGEVACISNVAFPAVEKKLLTPSVLSLGVTVAGVSGTVLLPKASDVRGGVEFGAMSALSGTYVPDLPDAANVRSTDTAGGVAGTLLECTFDGATGCFVPSIGSIKAADTANFTGWDIRKKRNQTTGAILTFAGVPGQNKTCRNRANTTNLGGGPGDGNAAPGAGDWDNTASPAVAGLDFFDTIDDYHNGLLGLPSDIPAWTMIASNNYGVDYACGGIYATGDIATGNTGADAGIAHDANGNWQDLTPGIIPAATTTNSTNTANGCNAADKHCVFKELISGLMVTKVSAASYDWDNAIVYCSLLGKAGGVVANPIPIIGSSSYNDWRLPTQKELMQLYQSGSRSLNQTANLSTFFGTVETNFWSSSSVSSLITSAWGNNLGGGRVASYSKTTALKVVCVR